MNVFYPNPAHPDIAGRLQALASSGVRVSTRAEEVPGYKVLIEGRVTEEMLRASGDLKHVVIPFAGVPEHTLSILRNRDGITLHNLHHNAADTAELAVALLAACARQVVPLDVKMRRGDWTPRYEPSQSVLLEGKTALILGYGHIGMHIARACKGMGMQVLAVRRRAEGIEMDRFAEVHPIAGLKNLLPEANALILALPKTPDTVGLIGAKQLAMLPQHAILVNIARAEIVDEEALFGALESRHLHSAGLDVWYLYPEGGVKGVPGYFDMPETASHTCPSRFPFQDLDNVVMSPHRGGVSRDTEDRRIAALAEIVNAAAAGQPVPHQVDLAAGY